jgi:hypothetical protein
MGTRFVTSGSRNGLNKTVSVITVVSNDSLFLTKRFALPIGGETLQRLLTETRRIVNRSNAKIGMFRQSLESLTS